MDSRYNPWPATNPIVEQHPQTSTLPQTLHVTSSTVNEHPQCSNFPQQLPPTTPTSLSNNVTNGNIQLPINFVRADLSTLQLPVFDGKDPTCFKSFLKAFKSAIANNNSSDSDKFLLLERITEDESLSIVQAYESDDQAKALADAITDLTRHYIDPYKYADAICGKIRTYPPINDENDGKAMATLSRFLKRQLNKSENNLMATKELNGSSIMTIVANKLPD